jgi:serine/threonine-protein kinase
LTVGTRLGRYELLCPIAEGGMAQVWAAEQTGDLGFRKVVALKTIRPDFAYDASFRAMFLDEAQLASRIRHVNVVEVLDLGVAGDVVYQAMALIDGVSASEWQRQAGHRFDPGVATRIAIDMLRGLHAAHVLTDDDGELLGLVHRDVSPQNLIVGSDGLAKLADFGIAKAFGRATEETVAGDVKGKLGYVAPEQLQGLPAAPQSDLFSAGVVFWELLTGQRLFQAKGESDRRKLSPRDPRSVVPDLPASICEIVLRSLADSPFERYQTASEMADALEDAARRVGLDTSSRLVASTIERDAGAKMDAMRDRLRQAKKRAGFTPAPSPTPRSRRTAETQAARKPIPQSVPVQPTGVVTMIESPAPRDMPATRVMAPPMFAQIPAEGMTDTVTVAEPVYTPAPRARRPLPATAVPLALAGLLLAMLVGAIAMFGSAQRPPAMTTAGGWGATPKFPPPPPIPVMVAPPTPIAPPEEPALAPPPPPSASAPVAPAVHRPLLSHPRSRPAAAAAPVSKPAQTIAPRFENPY